MNKRLQMTRSFSVSLLIYCSLLHQGGAAKPIDLPSMSTLEIQDLKLVGRAQFSVLFWDIYQSSLYTTSGDFDGAVSGTLFKISYQRAITKQELLNKTIEQWQHLRIAEEEYLPYVPQLNTIWPDIEEGDNLTFFVEGNSSKFYFNGRIIGVIEGKDFAPLFLAIWLSPQTSQPQLRRSLLGIKS